MASQNALLVACLLPGFISPVSRTAPQSIENQAFGQVETGIKH
jgi:hypothetical protein